MEKEKNYIVGFDLGKRFAQISYVSFEGEDGDEYNIPVCMCKRDDANQWFYGTEAKKYSLSSENKLITDLLGLALIGDAIKLEEGEADPVELLAIFVRNCLAKLGFYRESVCIKTLVITVDSLSERMMDVLQSVKQSVLSNIETVYFETKVESLFHYTIHQPKELWSYEVGVLDISDGFLRTYRILMNHHAKPVLTTIDEKIHEDLYVKNEYFTPKERQTHLDWLDEKMHALVSDYLSGRLVTSFFLIGKEFDGDWYPNTLKLVCRNRKVFGGTNLYSKGACLGGMEKIIPGENTKNFLYIGKDTLKADIGIAKAKGENIVCEIVMKSGKNWYETKGEFTFMPGEDDKLPIVILPLGKKTQRIVPVIVPQIEGRDRKSLRFECQLYMKSPDELVVEMIDAGFGEFYPPTGKKYREVISLGVDL